MPASTPGTVQRTKGEALLDLDYAIEQCVLHQRFYERIDKGIALVSLLAGSAAFVTLFKPSSVVVTVAGGLVGVLSLLAQVYDFRGKATTHAALYRRYLRLKERSGKLDLEKLDAGMDKIAADAIPAIRGLRKVAYNNNVCRNGYTHYQHPLNRWERLLAWFT